MAITHANSTFLTVCQDEGAISQAWLKQAMAHKATLAHSALKLTVIQVPCDTLHHRSPSHRRPRFLTKEPHILRLQNPTLTRTAWLPGGTSVSTTVQKTGSFLFLFIFQTINCVAAW